MEGISDKLIANMCLQYYIYESCNENTHYLHLFLDHSTDEPSVLLSVSISVTSSAVLSHYYVPEHFCCVLCACFCFSICCCFFFLSALSCPLRANRIVFMIDDFGIIF